jgi:hypothetical protein
MVYTNGINNIKHDLLKRLLIILIIVIFGSTSYYQKKFYFRIIFYHKQGRVIKQITHTYRIQQELQ